MAKINIKLDKQFLSELTGSLNKSYIEGNKKLFSLFGLINNHKEDDTIDVKEITDFTNSIFSADTNNDGEVDNKELEIYVKNNENKFKEFKIKAKDILEFLNNFRINSDKTDINNQRITNTDGSYSIVYEDVENKQTALIKLNYDEHNRIITKEKMSGNTKIITDTEDNVLTTQQYKDCILVSEKKADGLTYYYNGNKTIVKNAEDDTVKEIETLSSGKKIIKDYDKISPFKTNLIITNEETGEKTLIEQHYFEGNLLYETKSDGLSYWYSNNRVTVRDCDHKIIKEIEELGNGKKIIKDYEKISPEQTIITITNEETGEKTQVEQAKPLIHRADVIHNYEDTLSKKELSILENILNQIDKEDMSGKIYKDSCGINGDYLLNFNEQQKVKKILQERYPGIYEIVRYEFEKYECWSHNEIIADNFQKIGKILLFDKSKYQNYIKYLTNDNISYVLDRNDNLLFNITEDSENVHDNKEYKGEFLNKFKNFADSILAQAKQQNVYLKDYEDTIKDALKKHDLKELGIALDRLNTRIVCSNNKIEIKEPNGKIDENFAQGYTGDCWLVAVIKSICLNSDVLDMLNQMISVNKEGDRIKSVTVNLPKKSYTIDYDNLKSANEYASGDLDVRAIEIAVNRYMHENNLGDISQGGSAENAYKYLFGDKIKIFKYEFKSQQYLKQLESLQNSNAKFIANQAHYGDGYKSKYAKDEDGNDYQMCSLHEYSFSRISSEYFYFRDPHAPQKELHIERKDIEDYFGCDGIIAQFK